MFFEIPYSQRGCSLLLRGGSDEELGKIKKVASFLLFARYNFRLELSFLLDEFARPPSPKHSIFDSNEQSPVNEDITIENPKFDDKQNLAQNTKRDKVVSIENVCDNSDPLRAENLSPSAFAPSMDFAVQATFDNRFRTSLSSSILSVSPYISMPLPYLESEAGRKCFLRSYFPNELYYSKQWAENVDRITLTELPQQLKISEQININPPHEFLSMKITAPIDNKDQQTAIANFRRCGGRYPNTATSKFSYVMENLIEAYVFVLQ